MKNKPILCFHVGYIPDFNNTEIKTTYGSEIALVKLSKEFLRKYRVVIFGHYLSNNFSDDIEYKNAYDFEDFQKNNDIDIIILSRYISPFLDFELKARKIFIWIHDVYLMAYYQGFPLPETGKIFLKNIIDKIDGIVCLTQWNKETFVNFYEIDPNKVFIIGNGIEPEKFNNTVKKQKNKFIWTSHGYRGLDKMVEYFHEVRKRLPDAELYVYRDRSAVSDEIYNEIEQCNYIHYGGKIENDKIIEEFLSSEMWFYPTNFTESCCISSLEAQISKCVCITSDLAGLKETVGDRGILIGGEIYSQEYKDKIIDEVVRVANDEELKKKYQDLGYNWVITQTWENKALEWYELFE